MCDKIQPNPGEKWWRRAWAAFTDIMRHDWLGGFIIGFAIGALFVLTSCTTVHPTDPGIPVAPGDTLYPCVGCNTALHGADGGLTIQITTDFTEPRTIEFSELFDSRLSGDTIFAWCIRDCEHAGIKDGDTLIITPVKSDTAGLLLPCVDCAVHGAEGGG